MINRREATRYSIQRCQSPCRGTKTKAENTMRLSLDVKCIRTKGSGLHTVINMIIEEIKSIVVVTIEGYLQVI